MKESHYEASEKEFLVESAKAVGKVEMRVHSTENVKAGKIAPQRVYLMAEMLAVDLAVCLVVELADEKVDELADESDYLVVESVWSRASQSEITRTFYQLYLKTFLLQCYSSFHLYYRLSGLDNTKKRLTVVVKVDAFIVHSVIKIELKTSRWTEGKNKRNFIQGL